MKQRDRNEGGTIWIKALLKSEDGAHTYVRHTAEER